LRCLVWHLVKEEKAAVKEEKAVIKEEKAVVKVFLSFI
jgi:hypothetical protein